MDPTRKQWFADQQALRKALKKPIQLETAQALFLKQHAYLHSNEVSGGSGASLEEEVWVGLDEAAFRCLPAGTEHSIAWCYWHLARIEDITMNLLVADTDQVYSASDWKLRLHAPFDDTGNMITPEDVRTLSEQVD
jgi:hypothetical protein